jgi:hypothetical protein
MWPLFPLRKPTVRTSPLLKAYSPAPRQPNVAVQPMGIKGSFFVLSHSRLQNVAIICCLLGWRARSPSRTRDSGKGWKGSVRLADDVPSLSVVVKGEGRR